MNQKINSDNLGQYDLKIVGFQIWVHGYQFPNIEDYYDGNWLRVSAHCGASGASIWVHGSFLTVVDVANFGSQCTAMHRGASRLAELNPIEPDMKILLEFSDNLGHINAQVDITPDHFAQSHNMIFQIDQSYLPDIINQCSAIVEKFPIRGIENKKMPDNSLRRGIN